MPDTGAPWNIPYVAGTDLVSDWPTDSLALANAVASGLNTAAALVAVKSAVFTGTQSAAMAAGASTDITDLTITHEVADASNKLILMAQIGLATGASVGRFGAAFYDGSSLLNVGAAAGSRTQISAGGELQDPTTADQLGWGLNLQLVHTPGTGSKTYTVRLVAASASTFYINRQELNTDAAFVVRAASSFTLMEVSV